MEMRDKTAREDFTSAVTKHSHAMFRAARAVLDGDADAEDAVGEAVLKAWQAWHSLRKKEAVRAWLVKIAVNCAYEQRRKYGRVTSIEDLEELADVDEGLRIDTLWDAVLRLPEDHRVVVTLFYYEDLPLAEIAHTLGIPQGTVKSRLSRARENLKKMLGEEESQ